MSINNLKVCLIAIVLWSSGAPMEGASIRIPNGSFESPVTVFVSPQIDSWQKSAKPAWYDESGGFLWEQLTGAFKNTAPGSADHIMNCDGNQALWVFAVPEVELFQDAGTMDWNDPAPSREFNAIFEPGKRYQLSVGVIGGGGNMAVGVTLDLSLYYRNASGDRVTVAATAITNSFDLFKSQTQLLDFHVRVPTVSASDPWAGRNIGVAIRSTVTPELQGGYWDVDNVRLSGSGSIVLRNPTVRNGTFGVEIESEPGLTLEILAATDISVPVGAWTSLGTVTNVTGSVSFTDLPILEGGRFYRVQQAQ